MQQPAIAPYMTFLVEWGHTPIGLSLIFGCMDLVSSPFGVLLMAIYYCAHMGWPYIESHVNFIVDDHLVYGAVLVYLMANHAGHVWGLDGLIGKLPAIAHHPLVVHFNADAAEERHLHPVDPPRHLHVKADRLRPQRG